MPMYSFATYADVHEQWAIRADSLEQARALIGDDANGEWLDDAIHLEAAPVTRRDEFVLDDDDEAPFIEEITPDHWAWRAAHRDYIEHSLKQNIAAISGDFHTPELYGEFYETFGKLIDGFVGQYELCIAMAEPSPIGKPSTAWAKPTRTLAFPGSRSWRTFVETVLETAIADGTVLEPATVLPTIQVLVRSQTAA